MSVLFLSILGTGNYSPIIYAENTDNLSQLSPEKYVQIATTRLFKDEIDKIVIFVTKEAKEANWLDKESNMGLQSQLLKEFPPDKIKPVDIPSGNNAEEISTIFDAIYDSILEKDEIIFDITHSFRFIPMLALVVMNYARNMKNARIRNIFYGNFLGKCQFNGIEYAPLMDLTVYNDILEWTNAANTFIKYGNVGEIKKLREEDRQKRIRSLNQENLRKEMGQYEKTWKPVKKAVDAMDVLANAMIYCRGSANDTTHKFGIKPAYKSFKEICNNSFEYKDISAEIKPLYHIMSRIESEFTDTFNRIENDDSNYMYGLCAAKWLVNKGYTQQGYTALRETFDTYLCERYGADPDDKEERTLISNFFNSLVNVDSFSDIASNPDIKQAMEKRTHLRTLHEDYKKGFFDGVQNDISKVFIN